MNHFQAMLALFCSFVGGTCASSHGSQLADRPVDAAPIPLIAEIKGEVTVGHDGTAQIRSRTTQIDAEQVRLLQPGQRVALQLFDDVQITGIIDKRRQRSLDRVSFTGHLDGVANGSFRLATNGPAVVGSISAGALGSYRIWFNADGTNRIVQRDPGSVFTCENTARQTVGATSDRIDRAGEGAGDCDDGSTIDVLILYTAAAQSAAGGPAGILAEIDVLMDFTNDGYDNSAIPLNVALVRASLTDYDECCSHLSLLTNDADGVMDEAHTLRNQYGADVVALIRSGGGGSAWGLGSLDPGFESLAFSQNGLNSSPSVLAHEIGHNEGCCHAVGDGGGCGVGLLFDWSNGWRFVGDSSTEWRTIMAYSPGTRITHFSNPSINFDGQPTGEVDAADNAQTIDMSRSLVANFRCAVFCPGDSDGNLVIGVTDLLALLAAWGTNDPAFDIVMDGDVNTADLLALLSAWGPCS